MMLPLVVLAVIMAVVVWWLFRQTLNVHPWVERRPSEMVDGDGALSLPPIKVGLGVFLGVATSLFALAISAYFMRRLGEDWSALTVPKVLWLNTVLLVLSSIGMERTRAAAQWGQLDGVRTGLMAAGAFSFLFLGGQLWAWQQFLLTALHGAHLLGGLWVWGRTTAKVWRGAEVGAVRLSVELCTVYWHYLLLIWLALFALLLST